MNVFFIPSHSIFIHAHSSNVLVQILAIMFNYSTTSICSFLELIVLRQLLSTRLVSSVSLAYQHSPVRLLADTSQPLLLSSLQRHFKQEQGSHLLRKLRSCSCSQSWSCRIILLFLLQERNCANHLLVYFEEE